ncbi:MAG: molecular chaperone TorD family protein [Burkholderiaceae bacterium]
MLSSMRSPSAHEPSDASSAIGGQDPDPAEPGDDIALRVGTYGLLAALLRQAPGPDLCTALQAQPTDVAEPDEAASALRELVRAAAEAPTDQIAAEYEALFIGLGRGELVPYASWYLTGFLMERPLGRLREDLAELGFERQGHVTEPEDHVAALCEVMSMLAQDRAPFETQKRFFERHLSPWLERFFTDLQRAPSAHFYRSVGRFGRAFVELETRYLSMRR